MQIPPRSVPCPMKDLPLQKNKRLGGEVCLERYHASYPIHDSGHLLKYK